METLGVMSGRGRKRSEQERNPYPHYSQVTTHKSLRPRRNYMLARYYTSGSGRFLQVDPGYDYEDPRSFNRYIYCLGNPSSSIDPSGLRREEVKLTAKERARLKFWIVSGRISPTDILNQINTDDTEGTSEALSILWKTGLWSKVDWRGVHDDVWTAALAWSVSGNVEAFKNNIKRIKKFVNKVGFYTMFFLPPVSAGCGLYATGLQAYISVLSGGDPKETKTLAIDTAFLSLSVLSQMKPLVKSSVKLTVTGRGLRWRSIATGRFVSGLVAKYDKETIEATNLGVSLVLLDMKEYISDESDNNSEDNSNEQ